jgi:hypothetical protein
MTGQLAEMTALNLLRKIMYRKNLENVWKLHELPLIETGEFLTARRVRSVGVVDL